MVASIRISNYKEGVASKTVSFRHLRVFFLPLLFVRFQLAMRVRRGIVFRGQSILPNPTFFSYILFFTLDRT